MPEALLQIGEPGELGKQACKGRVVGIDLGTTHSLVAAVEDGSPRCIPDAAGRILLPSVVHYAEDGSIIVGEEAVRLGAEFPADTISSVKRFMGRGVQDIDSIRELTPYRFVEDTGGIVRLRVARDRQVTPIEVSAEILRVLGKRGAEELGGVLEGAVITVPAYFDDAQRQATRDAGRLAGLEVLRLLAEPTAAALAYGLDKKSEGLFAVFDLGGGTFDISILKLDKGVFEVKSTGGDSQLGGDDFDRALAQRFLAEMGEQAAKDRRVVRQAVLLGRLAKERLTTEESTEIVLGERSYRRKVTRQELEEVIGPILERTVPACRQALKDAGIAGRDLDGVILVGGSTRTPAVRAHVAALFGQEPLADIDPDQVVALGAAVQADLLAGSGPRDDVLLLDVIPLSLGLEMMGGVVEKIIPRNSTIPCGARQTFTTFADNQTGFDLHVLQGERELVDQCRSLARFQLKGIPPRPAGMARAEVTFLVDADGILRVSAREEMTGKEAFIEVKPSYGLSEDEIERMLRDSYEHASEDVQARLLVEQRVEADRILRATERALANDGGLLSAEERKPIDRAIEVLERVQREKDPQAIRQAVEALDAASKEFASRRMNRAMDQNMTGRSLGEIEGKL